ncbi:hypothetical protein DFJ58DRAFT_667317 [Suillus subalutaceus]|uniref:uncharacterized protein n=1 Tax=Suillus subalutaceus TaxID=48586 RepID=UPI001B87345D|nr:uncharacterized protein DFJ58DRAFT_667317 [Suillus subalutaceus]KAG1840181.1 hypothetical protein DFJ58DRAFT_667317 [Suillus subalutaceus]
MDDLQYSLDLFKHLGHRSVLPLVSHPISTTRQAAATGDLPDLNNVQGDVIYLFPKKAENFVFFRINSVVSFRTALQSFKPTTAEDVKDNLISIAVAKANAHEPSSVPTVDIAQYQISFSRAGLYFLGVNEDTGDVRFDKRCMNDDKELIGDTKQWDPMFVKAKSDPVNGSVRDDTGALHGVITVAGSSAETCTKASNEVIDLFGSSITPVEGRARPPPYKGHEHFGFRDGISQPCLRGLVIPRAGQLQVDPGVIIMGYPGDPVRDDPTTKVKRPAWTKDGTISVFRKLEQSVISFENHVQRNGPRWREFIPGGDISPPLNNKKLKISSGHGLLGGGNRDYYCPFTSHTRKIAPRNLYPYIDAKFLGSGSIVRAGLPYGDEVRKFTDILPRGLLFNCYMSSLDSGFVRHMIGYARNDYWPMTSLVPQKKGQDPVIGSPPVYTPAQLEGPSPLVNSGDKVDLQLAGADGATFEVCGFAKVTPEGVIPPPGEPNPFFIAARGGEYFFVPSVSTLKSWASATTTTTTEVCTLAKEQKATVDDTSKDLYGRLSSSTQVNTFDVEDIYVTNEQCDKNVQIRLNAEQMDDNTISQIKEVSLPISVGLLDMTAGAGYWFPSQTRVLPG